MKDWNRRQFCSVINWRWPEQDANSCVSLRVSTASLHRSTVLPSLCITCCRSRYPLGLRPVTVASAIFYGVVCWGGSILMADRKRLDKLVKKASSFLGCPLDSVEVVGERRIKAKLSSLMQNMSHPMQDTLKALSSSFSGPLLHPRCIKERNRRSFLPVAVRVYNQHCCQ